MAFTYGFYNSKNKDRRYNADQMSQLFDGILNDGVFNKVGELMMVVPGTGLQVLVKSGRAWFNSTWSYNDAAYPLNLSTPDVTVPRIDAVVLEVDHTETVRRNRLLVVKGIAASNPEKPALTNTDLIHQHPLAYVTLRAGAESISSSDIEIMVGKDECPFVTGILETASLEDLFAAWDEQFTTWFDDIKSQLDGDVATNLLNEINKRVKIDDKASQSEARGLSDDTKWMTPLKTKYAVSEHPDVGKIKVDGSSYSSNVTSLGNFFVADTAADGTIALSTNKRYLLVLTSSSMTLYSVNPMTEKTSRSGNFSGNLKVIFTDSFILIYYPGTFSLYRYTSSSITPIVETTTLGKIHDFYSIYGGFIHTPVNLTYFIVFGRQSSRRPIFQRINLSTGAIDDLPGMTAPSVDGNELHALSAYPMFDSSGNTYYCMLLKKHYSDYYRSLYLYRITPSGSLSEWKIITEESQQIANNQDVFPFLVNGYIYIYTVTQNGSPVNGNFHKVSLSGKLISTTAVSYDISSIGSSWTFLINGSSVTLGAAQNFLSINTTNGSIGSKVTTLAYYKSSFELVTTNGYFSIPTRKLLPPSTTGTIGSTRFCESYAFDGRFSKLLLG